MTYKEKKSKIADILLEFYEEYQCNIPNRPMIPSLYASKIIDSLLKEPASEELEKVVEEIVDATVLNAYGVKEIANRLRRTMIESVIEDLKEAAKDYAGYRSVDKAKGFLAGTNWQKQKDAEAINENALLYNARLEGIEIGKTEMKQQLMANAVDGVVHHFEKCKVASVHYNDPIGVPMAYFTSPEGLSEGDKVKIIVIKENEN